MREIGCRRVGALAKGKERGIGILGRANGIVWKNPFAHARMVIGGGRRDRSAGAAGRFGIGVRVIRRLLEAANRAWPPSDADALVRVRLTRDVVRTIGHAAGMRRRPTAGEARARQVEAAPPEVRRARFTEERAAKLPKYLIAPGKDAPASVRRIGVVRVVRIVCVESL